LKDAPNQLGTEITLIARIALLGLSGEQESLDLAVELALQSALSN